jgi:hypothetical protein
MTVATPTPVPPPAAATARPTFDFLTPVTNAAAADSAAAAKSVNHYDRTQIRIASSGEPVAVVTGGDAKLLVGANTALAPDGKTIRATATGRVRVADGGRLCVETALEIAGDVDFSVGNVDFPGDVVVRGNVLDLFKLYGGGSIEVGGAIEAAEVRAAKDLRVAGSIVAKDRGSICAGGNVHAKFVTNARVEAAGDVEVQATIANSTVVAAGRVAVPQGSIVAGKTAAAAGVVCKTLGSAAGVMTVVEVGVDDLFRRELPRVLAAIEAQRQKARKIEQTVQPLLANQKKLTPAQKEKATELLFEAQEMTQAAERQVKALKERYATITSKSRPEVEVADTLHQGVVLRFPGLQTRIMTAFKGPLRVVLKHVRGERTIQLIEDGSRASQTLGGESIPDPVAHALHRLLNPTV